MGTMTGQDFIDELTLALENRADAAMSSPNVLRWLNHAYWHMTYPTVHAFENFRVTYDHTLVTNQWSYATGSATTGYRVLGVRSVHYIDATPAAATYSDRPSRLKPRNIRWYDERIHSTGEPRFYVPGEGETLLVTPVPSANQNGNTLRCRLWREATAILVGTTTEVPSYFDEVLMLGAQAVAEYRLGYRDRARETLEHYTAMLNDPLQKDEIEGEDWGFESQLVGEPHMGVST